RARVTASSSAAAAARAVSIDGSPGVQSGCRPITAYSAESGICFEFSARSTISGPIPAQSPSVIPIRTLSLIRARVRARARLRAREVVDLDDQQLRRF